MVLEYTFKKLNWNGEGINIDGEYPNHIRFSDYIVVTMANIVNTRQMIIKQTSTSIVVGLHINSKKTEFMTNLKTSHNIELE